MIIPEHRFLFANLKVVFRAELGVVISFELNVMLLLLLLEKLLFIILLNELYDMM